MDTVNYVVNHMSKVSDVVNHKHMINYVVDHVVDRMDMVSYAVIWVR